MPTLFIGFRLPQVLFYRIETQIILKENIHFESLMGVLVSNE